MEIITISIFCISGVIFAIYIGEQHKVFGQLLTLAILIFVMLCVVDKLAGLLNLVDVVWDLAGIHSTYLKLLLKMTGIIFVAEFTSDLCEQGGYKAISRQILLFGRLAVLMVGYPLLLEFIQIMQSFLT